MSSISPEHFLLFKAFLKNDQMCNNTNFNVLVLQQRLKGDLFKA